MLNSIDKYSKVIAEIDLNNLDYNLRQIRKTVNPAKVIAVVKADAYGHGILQVVDRLLQNNVDFFAVARIKEALVLANNNIKTRILIFARLNKEEIELAIKYGFRITLTNLKDLDIIEQSAKKLNIKANIHLNIDTGMGRIGILPKTIEELIGKMENYDFVNFEGIYSHFSTSDLKDKCFAYKQLGIFQNIIHQFQNKGIDFPMIHIANSGAILDMPETYRDMFNAVRTGIILYGCYPSVETSESIDIKPVMTIKTRVLEIRELEANQPISYGLKYYTSKKSKIAVLPIGYADGISRIFTNKSQVMINEKLYPIVGTVTMDQILVVVDNDVYENDEVIFWGNFKNKILKSSEVAHLVGTISYELCTSITNRVYKQYID